MSVIGELLQENLDDRFNAEEQKAVKEMIAFLEGIKKDIPKAIKELEAGKVGSSYTVTNLVGKLIRSADEEWYSSLYR